MKFLTALTNGVYALDESVVMPNHVHLLVTPLGEHRLSDILHSWKSFTAKPY
jgi:REP element-mobilizing transposase RayT